MCRIVIENLDQNCSKSSLETVFKQFGEISTLSVRVNGTALLKYSVPDAAHLAIQRMNMVPLCGCCLCVSIISSLYLDQLASLILPLCCGLVIGETDVLDVGL